MTLFWRESHKCTILCMDVRSNAVNVLDYSIRLGNFQGITITKDFLGFL